MGYILIILYTLNLLITSDPLPENTPFSKVRLSHRPSSQLSANSKKSDTNDIPVNMTTLKAD